MPRRAKRNKKLQQARRPLQPIDPNVRVTRNTQELDKPSLALVLSPEEGDDVFSSPSVPATAQQLLATFGARTGSQQLRAQSHNRTRSQSPPSSSSKLLDADALLRSFHARTGSQQLLTTRATSGEAGQVTPRSAQRLSERREREHLYIQQTPTRRRAASPRIEQGQEEHDARPPSSDGDNSTVEELREDGPKEAFYYSRQHRRRKHKACEDAARSVLDGTLDYRSILGVCNRICGSCSALHWKEEKLTSSSIANPEFNCCARGSIRVPLQLDFPDGIMRLLASSEMRNGRLQRTRHSEEFHRLIRHYNNAFSFSSLGA